MPPDAPRDLGPGRSVADRLRVELLDAEQVTDDLVEEILSLYARAFERWPNRDPEVPLADYLRWKQQSPACPVAARTVRLEGRLVQASSIWSYRVRVRGRSRLVVRLSDDAVDPDYQGQGVYSATRALWTRREPPQRPGHDLLLSDSVNPLVTRQSLRQGSRPLANRISSIFRVFDPPRFLRELPFTSRMPRSTMHLLLHGLRWLSELRAMSSRPAPGSIRSVPGFDARIDGFFERAAQPFELIVERTARHLNWRYCDRRSGAFVVRCLEEAREIAGYAALRSGRGCWQLTDLLALPGRLDVVRALLDDAVSQARVGGASGLSGWLPSVHPYRAIVRRAGFIDARDDAHIRATPIDMPPTELSFLKQPKARVHFTLGDTDLV